MIFAAQRRSGAHHRSAEANARARLRLDWRQQAERAARVPKHVEGNTLNHRITRRWVALAGAAAVTIGASVAVQAVSQGAASALSATTLVGKVVAYATTNGSENGAKQTFGPGQYRANAGELAAVGNDLTRLLELGPAMRVRACQHDNIQTGNSCQTVENLTAANKTFAVGAGISKLEVRALVVGYREANFGGVAEGFEVGRHEVALGDFAQIGNDTISSLRLAPGLTARLCSDNPETTTGGTCGAFVSSAAALGGVDNNGSWLEVRPVTVAHQNTALTGTSQLFGPGIFTAGQLSVVGNDTVSSLTVPEGVSTRICTDDPTTTTGGSCGTFTKSAVSLSSTLDNRTSWVANRHTVMLFPHNEDRLEIGQATTLRGFATDPEDGQLTGANLRWLSSRDGLLGTGNVRTVTLSPGPCPGGGSAPPAEHVISLIATDSAGNQTRTDRIVTVHRVC